MRMHDGERRVVADCTDVAEMIGEPLELSEQRSQPDRPWRDLHAERCLGRKGKGEGEGDRAVARYAPGEHRGAPDRSPGHERFGAFVRVAEAFLQPHDRLAVRGKAEVT